jgi:hypothetical protein
MNVIPPMTHELSSGWDQPSAKNILVDDSHAVMTYATFKSLHEYSATAPTGVYEGKMWRRHDGLFDREFRAKGGKPKWLLCWYGPSDEPGFCSTNAREILLVDAALPEAA